MGAFEEGMESHRTLALTQKSVSLVRRGCTQPSMCTLHGLNNSHFLGVFSMIVAEKPIGRPADNNTLLCSPLVQASRSRTSTKEGFYVVP